MSFKDAVTDVGDAVWRYTGGLLIGGAVGCLMCITSAFTRLFYRGPSFRMAPPRTDQSFAYAQAASPASRRKRAA